MNRREFGVVAAGGVASGLLWTVRPALGAGESELYNERWRPQFHFTAQKGWINDPNGLVFYKGVYNLFFQHDSSSVKHNGWGENMAWGHAVSQDLVHWKQLPDAIKPYPNKYGPIWSGSAVVDENNTAGFQRGREKTLVAIYAHARGNSKGPIPRLFTQCIAYSNDRGRTWTNFSGNPVVPHIRAMNRDPKVVWSAPTKKWIMVLYLTGNTYRFLASPNLKDWTTLHDIFVPHSRECPDFFEMPVDGESGASKWVMTSANDHYLVGAFNGKRFMPDENMPQRGNYGKNYYSVQTYFGLPDRRRVQMAWMAGGDYPGMPFNQQLSFPYELKLRRFGPSLKLCALPVREIESLYRKKHSWKGVELKPWKNPLDPLSGELWDIDAEVAPGNATEVGFRLRGQWITYSVKEERLSSGGDAADMPQREGRIKIRVLLDRTSVEIFGNDGEVVFSNCIHPDPYNQSLEMFALGGTARIVSMRVYELKSIWH